jgi:hypothetical protein
VSEPVVFRVVRPYRSVEDFLQAEGAWIGLKQMLIAGAEELPPETMIRFGVDLESGESLIRAEARVVSYIQPTDGCPAGLQVKFKRYGASTKSFLERALEYQKQELGALPEPTPSEATLEVPDVDIDSDISNESVRPESIANPAPNSERRVTELRQRMAQPVNPPGNRDELLARLRERARQQQPKIESLPAAASKVS